MQKCALKVGVLQLAKIKSVRSTSLNNRGRFGPFAQFGASEHSQSYNRGRSLGRGGSTSIMAS